MFRIYSCGIYTLFRTHWLCRFEACPFRLGQLVGGRRDGRMADFYEHIHWVNKWMTYHRHVRVESRIIFKILQLVYKCVTGTCSENLKYKTKNCRSQEYLMLEVKQVNTKYDRRTFDYVGPHLWNAHPLEVRCEEDVEKFKGKWRHCYSMEGRSWKTVR